MKILLTILGLAVIVGLVAYLMKPIETTSPYSETPTITTKTITGTTPATSTPPTGTATASSTTTSTPPPAAMPTQDVLAVTVHGTNYKFTPSAITAKQGQKVRVTFVSDGGLHDFVLDDFNVRTKQLQAGGTETVAFTADKKGSFKYYCSVGNHRAMGMEGTLTVE